MSAKNSTAAKQAAQVKNNKLSKLLTSTTLAAAGLMAFSAHANADNWTDHVADVGNISIDTSIGNTTNISTNDSFVKVRGDGDINAGWTVNVMQPNSSAKYVLYDIEGDPTFIMGTLNANGKIYIFDQQGTIYGAGSVVNVGGIVNSTGFISDADIIGDNYKFVDVNTGGFIENNGSITVAEGGLAAFVSPQVINNGIITAKLGKVAMASGDKVTLDMYGDSLIEIAVDDKSTDGLIKNSGVINAEGGVVAMSVQTAKSAVDDVINMGGVVNASSATVVGGKIVLSGGKQGVVRVAGKLDASGTSGGVVKVTGKNVALTNTSVLSADAGTNGNGGDIRVIGENAAIIQGRFSARGGALGGNGGFVEVSGLNYLDFAIGNVDTTAANGLTGTLLIDPLDIAIIGGNGDGDDLDGGNANNMGNTGSSGTISFTDINLEPYKVTEQEIEAQSATTNIVIQAQRNITTAAGTTTDGVVTLANNRNLTIETQNNSGNNGTLDLTNLGFQVQGTGSMFITAATGTVGTGDVRVGKLLSANGNINVATDNGQIYLEKGAINVSGTGFVAFNASDRIFIDNDITTYSGNILMTADRFTIDDTDAGSDNLDQLKVINGIGGITITANVVTLGETGGDPGAGEVLLSAANGIVGFERKTAGTFGLGGATGDTMLSDAELASIRARELFIGVPVEGNNKVTAIYVDSVNTTANITGRVTLSNYLNQADGVLPGTQLLGAGAADNNNVMFMGTNTFNALTVNANDHIVTYGGAAINTVTGSMILNADANAQGVGALLMSFNSGIATNGQNFTYNGHEAITGAGATINAQGGNILLNNDHVFYAYTPDSLVTGGTGTITLNQWVKTFADPSGLFGPQIGSINNAGNAVLNTGAGQNTVNVGPGTFNETVQLVGQNNLWIKGSGQGITIVKPTSLGAAPALSNGTPWAGQTYTPVFLAKDAANVDVTGLSVDGTDVDSGTTAGLAYYNASGDVENVTILNGGAFGLYAVADSTKGHTARTVTATNVTSSGNSWAALAVIGNVLTANVTGGVYSGNGGSEAIDLSNGSKGTITNAIITTGSNSENAGIVFHGGHDWTITGGSITGSNAASTGIVDLGTVYGVPAAANVAINGVNISNVNTGVSANGGSNWDIDGGAYTGAAGATGTGVKFANLTGSNSTVKNLTVSGFNEGIVVDASAGTQLTGNLIRNIVSNAVSVINSASVQILNNVIGYTTLAATTEAGSSNIGGDGIKVNNGGSVVIKGNKIAQTNGAGAIEVINTNTATIGGAGSTESNRIRNSNGGDGIRMESDSNVTVENNNIDGTNRVGIWGGSVSTAIIKNNIVRNDQLAGYGSIHADGGSNWTVSGNDIDFGDYGIRLNTLTGTNTINGANKIDNVTADAIYVVNTTGLTVASNQIGANGGNVGGNGIFVDPSNVAQLYSNTITNVGGNGIWSLNNDGANIYSNTITGAGLDGILVQGGNGVNIGGNGANTIKKSGDDGIDVENTTGTVIVKNNVIDQTGLNAASDVDQNGIEVSGVTGVVIEANKVSRAAWDGINVQQTTGATIQSNQVFDTLGASGIGIHNGTTGTILVDGNVITKALQFGMWIGGSTGSLTVTNNDISGITQSDGIYVNSSTGTININSNDIYNVGRNGIWGTGDIDQVNSNRVLKTGAHGILVTNSANVDIKSNKIGEQITGTNAATRLRTTTATTISSSNSNNTASAGNIGDDGIHVESSDYAEIIGNAVSNTVDDGIYINPSHYSVIAGNTLTALGNDGIESNGNNHITIGGALTTDANTISGAGAHGINVHGGVSALIQNNTVKGGTPSASGAIISFFPSLSVTLGDGVAGAALDGIHVENNDGVEILNNTITAGQGYSGNILGLAIQADGGNGANGNGIYVSNSDNAVIDTNLILPDLLGNGVGALGDGIHVVNSDNLTVGGLIPLANGNKIFSTGGDGIYINGSIGALVLNNIVSGAGFSLLGYTIGGEIGDDGIDMQNTLGTLVAGNIITNTGGDGIEFSRGALSAIGLNFITDAGDDGIDVRDSALVAVGLNTISGSDDNGIQLSNTHLSLVGWNTIDGSGNDGINVRNSTTLFVTENDISDIDNDGIHVSNSRHIDIVSNDIDDIDHDGINVSGGNDILIKKNHVTNVENDGIYAGNINGWNWGQPNVRIEGNTVDWTGENGIVVANVYDSLIDGNFVGLDGEDSDNSIGANGILVTNDTDDDPTVISNNQVANTAWDGIRVSGVQYVTVTDNVIENAGDDGIDISNANEARILRNTITNTGDDGITAYNIGNLYLPTLTLLEEGEGSEEGPYYALIIANNTITDAGQRYAEDFDDEGEGEFVPELPLGLLSINSLKIKELEGDGIDVYNSSSTLIDTNTVDNSYDDGIIVQSYEDRKREVYRPIFEQEGPVFGNSSLVVVRNNDVTNSGTDGIEVHNMGISEIDANRVLNSGVNGFLASGFSNGDVILTGNTFTNNPVGARFESGLIDLTGETNTFNGGLVGMQFDPAQREIFVGSEEIFVPYGEGEGGEFQYNEIYELVSADLNLVDDTIGTTVFNGQSNYYVELLNGALFNPGTPTILNGLNATYDGFRPSTVGGILTQAQYNAIEAKIYHYNDLQSLGLFFFGVVPANNINDKDIYRAFANFKPGNGPLSITITGLPTVPGFSGNLAGFLNGIAPAAGGNTPPKPKKFASLVEQLADLEPAAGGNDGQNGGGQPQGNTPAVDTTTCWGDAMAAASGGTVVSMSYGEGPSAALSDAASCQTGI